MTASWRAVAGGLRLVLIGAQVMCWALAATFALCCGGLGLVSALGLGQGWQWVVVVLTFTAAGILVLARLLCSAGRWVCMATPPEATKARTRIRLAVIFETCGLLCGAATFAVVVFNLPLPVEFRMAGAVFSLLTAALGRVCFFWFVWAVAEGLRLTAVYDNARFMARLSLAALAATVLGFSLAAFANQLDGDIQVQQPFKVIASAIGCILLFFAVGSGLYLFASHFIQVADLRKALAEYTPEASDGDPDAAYRERYLAAGGSDADA